MPDFSFFGIGKAQQQLITRPHDDGTIRIYLGADGPKYLIPTVYADAAEIWWVERRLGERMGHAGNVQQWGWRFWLLMSLNIPLYFALNEHPEIGGPFLLLMFLFVFWFRRYSHTRIRQDFERQFPEAISQPGRVARNIRIISVAMPRWWQIFTAVFCIGLIIAIKAYDSIFTFLENSDSWLSVFTGMIVFVVIFLMGIWGLYGVISHTVFRRKFKRRPTKEDFAANIDWFDGLDSGTQLVS
jgi:hypothetical protein